MQTSRRAFLKVGVVGAVALAGGGALYRLLRGPALPGRFVLDGAAAAALAAIAPVMLGQAVPGEAAARAAAVAAVCEQVQQAILGLPLATQKEVGDLFGLLALAPARRFVAGVSSGWDEASPDQVGAFLQSWRTHRFAMLQTAYHALHDLIVGCWYADPRNWQAIGYPGPLKELG
ncbi:hypothetical protein [Janthinobacterium fluminis]|uniref:Twin-arginine translocation signal domain-containing protein n=1 Tax=Janthinobacterium fluminis TaxID=2987524 RepID=A0ABT5K7R7_9BURK|nr:hypothetical protein [Janthinobacterium fluminis]MDC8760106.1 hypothetical protein [Janthinobacterium fluminis]